MREEVSALIKTVNDKDTAQELAECNRRLEELRVKIAVFLSQGAPEPCLLGGTSGKTQRNFALHAAPINVADFLRERLFGDGHVRHHDQRDFGRGRLRPIRATAAKTAAASIAAALHYFARQVGGEKADSGPGRLALRLRAANENLRRRQDARSARRPATNRA